MAGEAATNVAESSSRAMVQSKPPAPLASSSSPPPAAEPRGCCNCQLKCLYAKLLAQNQANFRGSASPARFMYFNRDGLWLDIPLAEEAFGSLKSAFADGRPMTDASVDGASYLFDFLRMLQFNLQSGNYRSIAWIDEKGKCFFPRMFIAEEEEEDEAGSTEPPVPSDARKTKLLELLLDDNSIKQKEEGSVKVQVRTEAKSSEKQEASERALVLWLPEAELPRWPNTRQLRETEMVFSLFKDFFMSGIKKADPGATVTAIYQCTRINRLEKTRHDVFEKQIELTRKRRGASNMLYAWHGTSINAVKSILAHGFGTFSIISGRQAFGTGVYLSPLGLPHMCARFAEMDGNGEKHVVLCKVVLGNVEKVQAGSQQHCPSHVDFDSAVDDFVNPKWYVVWPSHMNNHIIPECVVSFKPSTIMQGQERRSTGSRCFFDELYTKLKKLLPPAKFQELVTFYNAFKDGKLARDTFMKELRRVAGQEVLTSAVQEIQGKA